MVGEEEVAFNSEYNDLPDSKGQLVLLKAKENFEGRPHPGFGLENARIYFIAQRLWEGADTPIGHRWSNLIELSQSIYGSSDPVQRDHCMAAFARNLMEIRDLKRSQPPRLYSAKQLLLAYSTNTFH